ncbi:2S seed storage albumin protein-like [Salvia hispanica]|uniref:2S seed storage albumin protein-like n=1 Tax=Salvia hispanica TaxID=49212 RepID=UPI00200943B7|nr:2S seed storage albumin protein-like [Salvia hispanica]
MATKAALTAALLMALVALASATTFTTTVTTASFEEEGNPRQQQCRQQLQGREFRSCQRYFSQRSSSPYEEEVEEEVLEMSTGRQTRHRQPQLNECCEQLRAMDRQQCGCEAIKHAVQKAQQQQQGGRSRYQTESEQIYQKARSLPRMCGLREQQCQFRFVLV